MTTDQPTKDNDGKSQSNDGSSKVLEPDAILVVEGLGDVVSGIYYKGFEKFVLSFLAGTSPGVDELKYRHLKIVFCYLSGKANASPALRKKLRNIKKLVTRTLAARVIASNPQLRIYKTRSGSAHTERVFESVDKQRYITIATLNKDEEPAKKVYEAIRPTWVLISTPDKIHARQVCEWLNRDHDVTPPVILIEKPLEAKLDAIRDMLEHPRLTAYNSCQVWAFDHYLGKAPLTVAEMERIQQFLGGYGQNSRWLERFAFFFVEDHTALDGSYVKKALENVDGMRDFEKRALITRMGPVEIELRETTLEQGMILDGAPHLLAVLSRFPGLRVDKLRVHSIRAGRYRGVDPLYFGDSKVTSINDSISRITVGLPDLGNSHSASREIDFFEFPALTGEVELASVAAGVDV